jgi:hypothetical protein
MAYFIFLKSLRSLGEFRKNPHVKIPSKSPYANFQSLSVFKKSNFIRPAQHTRTAQPATFLLPPAPKPGAHSSAAGRPRAASTVTLTPPPEEKNGRI